MPDYPCVDCDIGGTIAAGEYFLLKDAVWAEVVSRRGDNPVLCIGCTEASLGRELERADFRMSYVNSDMMRMTPSKRLWNRQGRGLH